MRKNNRGDTMPLELEEYEQFLQEAQDTYTVLEEQTQPVARVAVKTDAQSPFQQAQIIASFKSAHGDSIRYVESLGVTVIASDLIAENAKQGGEQDEQTYAQQVEERRQQIITDLEQHGFSVREGMWT